MSPDAIDSAREFLAAIDAREGISCICDVCDVEEWLGPLLAHLDTQAAQIEALKEKLIHATARQLEVDEPCPGRTRHEYCGILNGLCDGFPHMFDECPRKAEKLEAARQQLKAEMPGVEWE